MARRTPEINPAQGTLIDVSQMPDEHAPEIITPAEHLPEAIPETPRPVETVYGPEGSYMGVYERAKGLNAALDAQTAANSREGFRVASNVAEYSGPIYGRYKWHTEQVKDKANANAREYSQEAKRQFWQYSGYAALKKAGLDELITSEGVDARASKDFREFMKTYASPNDRNSTNARHRIKRRFAKTQAWAEPNQHQKAA